VRAAAFKAARASAARRDSPRDPRSVPGPTKPAPLGRSSWLRRDGNVHTCTRHNELIIPPLQECDSLLSPPILFLSLILCCACAPASGGKTHRIRAVIHRRGSAFSRSAFLDLPLARSLRLLVKARNLSRVRANVSMRCMRGTMEARAAIPHRAILKCQDDAFRLQPAILRIDPSGPVAAENVSRRERVLVLLLSRIGILFLN